MNKKLFLITGIIVFSLISSNVSAQTVYSLYDLCKIADKNALQIKIAEDDLYISELEKERALSVLLPRLTAFGLKNRTSTDYKNQIPDRKMDSTKDTESFGVQLDQSFTLNGKELIALKVTQDGIEKTEYDLETIKSDYMFEISTVYYQILSAKKDLEISIADEKRLLKHRNSVNEKLQVGTVTKTALFRAEAEHSKSKTNFLIAESTLKLAKASLKNLVDIDEEFALSDDRYFYVKDFDLSFDQFVTEAIANRTELKSIQKTCEVADKTVRYERGSYWPTISIKGVYADSKIISDYDSKYSFFDSETNAREKSIEASFSFTLFDGGLRKAQISQALARKRQAYAALTDTKNKITLESKKAWFYYQTSKSTIETLNDELKSAKENFNAVTMQFEYGLSDSVDMMDADTLLVSAERKLAEAEYQYVVSILDMIRLKGGLLKLLL